MPIYTPPLEPGIATAVIALNEAGIETFTSCEGGAGHPFPEPTVRFYGDEETERLAVLIVLAAGLPLHEVRFTRAYLDGEPTTGGPFWELVFYD